MAVGSYSRAHGETALPRCEMSRSMSNRCSEQAPKSACTRCQQSVTARPSLSASGKGHNSFGWCGGPTRLIGRRAGCPRSFLLDLAGVEEPAATRLPARACHPGPDQFVLEDLPERVLRQLRPELEDPGDLVGGQAFPQVGPKVSLQQSCRRMRD